MAKDIFLFLWTRQIRASSDLGPPLHLSPTSSCRPPGTAPASRTRVGAAGLTDVGREGQAVHGGVQVDHVRRAALAVQVSRESLRGHEKASGPARRGDRGGQTDSSPLPSLTCTKVVFPEPAMPSTRTHTGAAAAAAIFPAAACSSGARWGGGDQPRSFPRVVAPPPAGYVPQARAASPHGTARSRPGCSWRRGVRGRRPP